MPVLTNRSKLLCHNRRCLLCSISKMRIISRHSPSTCSLNTLWRLDGRVCTLDWSCQARLSRHDTVSGISNRSACGNLVANMKRMRAYLDFCAALGCMRSATDMYTHPVRLLQRLLEVLACRRALLALGPFSVVMEVSNIWTIVNITTGFRTSLHGITPCVIYFQNCFPFEWLNIQGTCTRLTRAD